MINIPKQIYAGWASINSASGLPDAELIPYAETDKKNLKSFTDRFGDVHEYENIPLPGYYIHELKNGKYTTDGSFWSIIDPRGFMTKISSNNLNQIIRVSGISSGLIQERCVWIRSDNALTMTLLPISSSDYILAVKNTKLIEDRIDIKNVDIGDKVLLQSGHIGIYMGIFSLYGGMRSPTIKSDYSPNILLRKQVVETNLGKFYYDTDLKILKILEKGIAPRTVTESMAYINQYISDGTSLFMREPYVSLFNSTDIRHISLHATGRVKINLEEITKDEAIILFYNCLSNSITDTLVVESAASAQFLIYSSFVIMHPEFTIDSFETISISKIGSDRIFLDANERAKMLFRIKHDGPTFSINDFNKFYKITKKVGNEIYI